MKARLLVKLMVVGTFLSYALIARCWTINATGGSFPNKFYADTTFAYQFQPSGDFVTYFGAGSTTGKCNIMGYWHTGDTLASQSSIPAATKARDALICTDACTVATCGISSVTSPRFDRNSRRPLVDFAGSDSVLKAADYEAFPDLLMFPAFAGAVVPLYNIPELRAVSNISLVLSRQNIADIFKGEVLFWNDSRILASNPVLRSTLIKISHRIRVLVRTDSSGTSEIFSTALARFDPMGIRTPDYSFAATVGAGSNPSWCGLLTDEIQIITVVGCNSALPNIQKLIYMKVVSAEKSMRDLTFACDATAENITAEYARTYPGANLTVVVNKKVTSTGIVKLQIGYGDPFIAGKKWYKPAIVSLPVGVIVSISTLQEGGYFNSHYNSTYIITPQVQSIWIASSTSSFRFVVSLRNIMGTEYNITLSTPTSENEILASFNSVIANSVEKVRLVNSTSSPWIEFRVIFTGIASSQLSAFTVHSELQRNSDAVYITTYLDFNNYPLFYDYKHPTGFGGSGRFGICLPVCLSVSQSVYMHVRLYVCMYVCMYVCLLLMTYLKCLSHITFPYSSVLQQFINHNHNCRYTCYLKQYGYKPWSYYTGDTNSGIVAEVRSVTLYRSFMLHEFLLLYVLYMNS